MVEEVEVGAPADDGDPLLGLVDAAQTPPLFTDVRVVLGRITEKRERGELVQPLVDYLAGPAAVVPARPRVARQGAQGARPRRSPRSVARSSTPAPGARSGSGWRSTWPTPASRSTARVASRLVTWVGDEPSRLLGLLDLLRSTYGPGAKITAAEIEPFLGDDGGVPPWDLTDAIDRGDRAAALELLQRMIGQGDRHPFQVLGTLHSHFARMLRLDGAEVTGEKRGGRAARPQGLDVPGQEGARPGPSPRPRAGGAGDRPARRGRPRPARGQGVARPPRARGARGPPGHDVAMTDDGSGRHLEPQPPVPAGPPRGGPGRLPLGARPRVRAGVPPSAPRRARRRRSSASISTRRASTEAAQRTAALGERAARRGRCDDPRLRSAASTPCSASRCSTTSRSKRASSG